MIFAVMGATSEPAANVLRFSDISCALLEQSECQSRRSRVFKEFEGLALSGADLHCLRFDQCIADTLFSPFTNGKMKVCRSLLKNRQFFAD